MRASHPKCMTLLLATQSARERELCQQHWKKQARTICTMAFLSAAGLRSVPAEINFIFLLHLNLYTSCQLTQSRPGTLATASSACPPWATTEAAWSSTLLHARSDSDVFTGDNQEEEEETTDKVNNSSLARLHRNLQ